MSIALWVIQVITAAAFIMAGGSKVIQPIEELGAQMTWILDLSPALVRFIGVCEVLGALGIILPAITRILPWLTPLAATGLALIMLLAGGFHAVRGELISILPNAGLCILALFIAYGRFKLQPIEGK